MLCNEMKIGDLVMLPRTKRCYIFLGLRESLPKEKMIYYSFFDLKGNVKVTFSYNAEFVLLGRAKEE